MTKGIRTAAPKVMGPSASDKFDVNKSKGKLKEPAGGGEAMAASNHVLGRKPASYAKGSEMDFTESYSEKSGSLPKVGKTVKKPEMV